MSEIVSLSEARAKLRAPPARASAKVLTDDERTDMLAESMKLAFEAILEIFERLEAIEKTHSQASIELALRSDNNSR
jgi:hypothetical protein